MPFEVFPVKCIDVHTSTERVQSKRYIQEAPDLVKGELAQRRDELLHGSRTEAIVAKEIKEVYEKVAKLGGSIVAGHTVTVQRHDRVVCDYKGGSFLMLVADIPEPQCPAEGAQTQTSRLSNHGAGCSMIEVSSL